MRVRRALAMAVNREDMILGLREFAQRYAADSAPLWRSSSGMD